MPDAPIVDLTAARARRAPPGSEDPREWDGFWTYGRGNRAHLLIIRRVAGVTLPPELTLCGMRVFHVDQLHHAHPSIPSCRRCTFDT